MKSRSIAIRLFTAAVVILGATCISTTASAQTKVALIDIGMIFKNHPQFSQQLSALKTEADQFKIQSDGVRQRLMQKAEMLSQLKPGSDDYKSLETKLAQEAAAIDVEQKDQLRELMSREARLHFDTYQQVTSIIRDYCQQRNIQLVLRYNSEQMNPEVPQSIMDKVNGSVVYFEQQKDVTADIVQRINQQNASANAGAGPLRK